MAAAATTWRVAFGSPHSSGKAVASVAPLHARLQLVRAVLVFVFVLSLSMVLQLLLVSPLQERSTQQRLYDRFRGDLAAGTAPIDASALRGKGVGAAIAYLEVPS